MESSHAIKQISFFFFLIFISCTNNKVDQDQSYDYNLFEQGDIICRLGNGFFSNQFKNYSKKEKIYSHVGIVDVSNDSVFVYHSEASELTGIGSVKREPLTLFLNKIDTWGVYRLKVQDSLKLKIVENANYYYERKTPFDMDFDLTDDTKLYCTEFVAVSVNKALNDSIIHPGIKMKNKMFYGIDDIYDLPISYLIHKVIPDSNKD